MKIDKDIAAVARKLGGRDIPGIVAMARYACMKGDDIAAIVTTLRRTAPGLFYPERSRKPTESDTPQPAQRQLSQVEKFQSKFPNWKQP